VAPLRAEWIGGALRQALLEHVEHLVGRVVDVQHRLEDPAQTRQEDEEREQFEKRAKGNFGRQAGGVILARPVPQLPADVAEFCRTAHCAPRTAPRVPARSALQRRAGTRRHGPAAEIVGHDVEGAGRHAVAVAIVEQGGR
jgi:hypothetical protein